jgi:REP element-mobilizing transposase RayT
MNTLEYQPFYRRRLPHVQLPGVTLFVTFRLVDSIPVKTMRRLIAATRRTEAALSRISDFEERTTQAYLEQRRHFGQWDTALNSAQDGPLWLRDSRIARLVVESLHYRDGMVYDLDTYCVMPNHVHVMYTPLPKEGGGYHAMSAIMHSLKRHTARQANLLLEREGDFWQHENYDHVVRDEAERQRIAEYILNNPVKAGLVSHWEDWEWSYCKHLS